MTRLSGTQHLRLFARPEHWEAAVRFYAETLELPMEERDKENGYAIYRLSERTTLGLEKADGSDPGDGPLAGRFTGLSFEVDDIESAYRDLSAAGVQFHAPPEKQVWGGTLAFLEDPAGNVLSLAQYPPAWPKPRPLPRLRGEGSP